MAWQACISFGAEWAEAIKNLKELGITYEVIGKGNTVLTQTPQPNEMFLKPNSKVILYTEDKKLLYSVVPDVTGLSIEKANELIINAGLNIKIKNPSLTGGATVIYQSVSAGAVLERNSIVEVEILHLDFED